MSSTINPILDEAERARRGELLREQRAAARAGISPDERTQQREQKADEWAQWLRRKMDSAGCTDPVVLLPDILARLQQLAEDHTLAAIRDLRAIMREALK